ncbi:MAG: polysaccharide deacetylase family protein [Armatimonadota bacterium]
MTTYLAAYDTENPNCHAALPRIVEMHEKHAMPATFFIVSGIIPGHEAEMKALLDNPLFEIASHTHTHELLATHSRSENPPVPVHTLPDEVLGSKQRLEDLFGRRVTGFRPPWGYGDGLKHAPRLLELLDEGEYQYVSSVLWGPNDTMPALVQPAYTYAAQGYPQLWEIPSCGWHENILKRAVVMLEDVIAPSAPFPGAMPAGLFQSPEDEFALNRVYIDQAVQVGNPHATLIWHPWSLNGFDPEMRMLALTFGYVRELGLPCRTFGEYAKALA